MAHYLYKLIFADGASYYGVTDNIKRRRANHEAGARLYSGRINFDMHTLGEFTDRDAAEAAEGAAIAADTGCRNVSPQGSTGVGLKRSALTKARVGAAAREVWKRPGYREHMSAVKKGKPSAARKVSPQDGAEMRRLHLTGVSTVKLAKQFGVSQATAWNYATGKYQ